MNIRTNTVSKVATITLGAVMLTGTAFADKPYWANGRGHHDRYENDRYSSRLDDRYDNRYDDYARVVDVDPIVRRVRVSVPDRECWNEDRPVYGGGGRTVAKSTIVGGLIGAAVGHRIGVHTGVRDPGTVIAGSLIGAAIGNNIGESKAERRGEYRQVGFETVQRCEVAYRDQYEERVEGYRVTYVYHGREYTTRMPYQPGRTLRVNVDVRPGFDDCDD